MRTEILIAGFQKRSNFYRMQKSALISKAFIFLASFNFKAVVTRGSNVQTVRTDLTDRFPYYGARSLKSNGRTQLKKCIFFLVSRVRGYFNFFNWVRPMVSGHVATWLLGLQEACIVDLARKFWPCTGGVRNKNIKTLFGKCSYCAFMFLKRAPAKKIFFK